MPATKKSLKAKLKSQGRRLPHGYELVARKKRTKTVARKKAAPRKKATKKRR